MLVLSRRLNEAIRLPALKSIVRALGVRPDARSIAAREQTIITQLRQSHRRTREQLRTASIGLGLARLQLQTGQAREAQATLDLIQADMQTLHRHLDADSTKSARRRPVPSPRLPRPGKRAGASELIAARLH
jgi:ATP/maltotriose-dependent transcriptional regulator MalT